MAAAKTSGRAEDRKDVRLGFSVLTPPIAWIAAFMVSVVLSPWICASGRRWVLYLVAASAFVAAAAGGASSWRNWKTMARGAKEEDVTLARRRFMAELGIMLAALFLVAIVALAVPGFVHRPCD